MFSAAVVPAIAFVLTLAFGVWLSSSGKPYNGILFNVHKLIALGTVVLTAVQLFGMLRDTDAPIIPIVLIAVATVCVIALFATGALMSMEKMSYGVMLTIHRVAPILAALTMIAAVHLLYIWKY